MYTRALNEQHERDPDPETVFFMFIVANTYVKDIVPRFRALLTITSISIVIMSMSMSTVTIVTIDISILIIRIVNGI